MHTITSISIACIGVLNVVWMPLMNLGTEPSLEAIKSILHAW